MLTFVIEDREEFKACVICSARGIIYMLHGREIIQSGIMQDENDIQGLEKYLRKRKVISHDEQLTADIQP